RETVRNACADQQRAGEPRTLRVRDRVDVGLRGARALEYVLEQWQRPADVVARRQLRYDAAVFAVHRDLRVQRMGEQAALGIVEREAGFVAGAFYAENEHGSRSR